ncbi:hypothetical protein HMPREF9488_01979 [Coprobacillus cateniformis]|jgi:hypothetical protein|uniref:Uncharacterized protein n=2 Tax=Erysipelotrichia TaxID=526524 RepID=E7GB39_9FIRM|nr:hypothetical protein HMPREF9488_01979 [Coprobacillus cateniformis]
MLGSEIMKIIACVDNDMGLMFHQRRQTQDRIVRENIKALKERIYMNEYSYQLYKDTLDDVIVDNDFIKHGENHYCLIENVSVKDCDIDEMILYRWNTIYPCDYYLDIDLSKFQLVKQEMFKGSSHEVTKEIYRKEKG